MWFVNLVAMMIGVPMFVYFGWEDWQLTRNPFVDVRMDSR